MKEIVCFLFCLCFLVIACEEHSDIPSSCLDTVKKAEQIIDTQDQEAYRLLKPLEKTMRGAKTKDRMHYYLLLCKAQSKCHINPESDSLIKAVAAYYDKNGSLEERMEARFYLGCTYYDLNDKPEAIKCFMTIVKDSARMKDYVLLAKTHSQMGYLTLYQDKAQEAIRHFLFTKMYAEKSKNKVSIVHAIKNLALYYREHEQSDSAIYYYEKCYRTALNYGLKELAGYAKEGMVRVYLSLKDYSKAKEALLETERLIKDRVEPGWYYVKWGEYYQGINQLDSAVFYYRKALLIPNIYSVQKASRQLCTIAFATNDLALMKKNFPLYIHSIDSVLIVENAKELLQAKHFYDYSLNEKEKERLALIYERDKWLMACMGLVIIGSAILIFWGVRLLRRRTSMFLQEKQERDQDLKIQQALLSRNSSELEWYKNLLEKKIDESSKNISDLQKQLEKEKERQQISKENLSLLQENGDTSKTIERQIVDCQMTINNRAKKNAKFTEKDWQQLQECIIRFYPGYLEEIWERAPKLSDSEEQYCMLFKLNIKSKYMLAVMVNIESSGIYSVRRRLSEKLFGIGAGVSGLNKFLKQAGNNTDPAEIRQV